MLLLLLSQPLLLRAALAVGAVPARRVRHALQPPAVQMAATIAAVAQKHALLAIQSATDLQSERSGQPTHKALPVQQLSVLMLSQPSPQLSKRRHAFKHAPCRSQINPSLVPSCHPAAIRKPQPQRSHHAAQVVLPRQVYHHRCRQPLEGQRGRSGGLSGSRLGLIVRGAQAHHPGGLRGQ